MIDESGQGVTKRDISALTKRDLSKYETFENYKTYGDAHNQCPNT